MLKFKTTTKKAITVILITTIAILNINISAVTAESNLDEIALQPAENQYLEMRATSIQEVAGKGKQVIMELWGHNLEFKGFDVRFSYDGNIFSPSDITTNDPTNDEKKYFKLENEFSSCTELFTLAYTR